ncbi:hypothetical protein JCM14244_01260 [Venenivibrio stagnispumantis]|uniref:Helix-turn-helix n=1 Tax=Venenivibrio stagnispumantis TaxID=407998 RepID=A0AA45WKF3_9AQUI|nr:helix-turn-helix transcriptional regulator [Venenivibrio stagnispumantis]MCW4573487.1 helix-turn-helix transcriptional regulator [Venenivibrio stagnispumantis]SMP06749.1 Helix-turn-helix [Venenivibrio stagnispumantis]
MNLKEWLEENKYDTERIYYGLLLDLSYYLKEFMIEKGLNKKQLAEKMGVSPAYITKIFSGQNISLKTVSKILSALEIDAGIKLINREKEQINSKKERENLELKQKSKKTLEIVK